MHVHGFGGLFYMAYIIPIKGLRYNTQKIPDLSLVVTPPYDVISEEEQDKYYDLHPNNIIRLEYGKKFTQDTEQNNRYTRASKDFSDWKNENILFKEKEPSIYIYAQEFTLGAERKTRLGIIAGVHIEPYERGIILPHEETMPKHKADRLALMQTCQANFSSIFSLYSDPERQIEKNIAKALEEKPLLDFYTKDNQRHKLWAIKEPMLIKKIQEVLADKTFFIADGHHRYETAMNYKNLLNKNNPDASTKEQPYDFVMMTLVNLYDPGLVVLPTHRLVKNLPEEKIKNLLEQIKNNFIIEEYQILDSKKQIDEKAFSDISQILTKEENFGHSFIFYMGGEKAYLVTLRSEEATKELLPKHYSKDLRKLDVSVLHSLIMEESLGIGFQQRANESNLIYTREELKAMQRVLDKEYQMIVFMNPTKVNEVTAVAGNREKMPQKSTFFYPKLPTGLLIMEI